ncbi:MAG: J domain-containing protein [Pseudomonadota bacterium]
MDIGDFWPCGVCGQRLPGYLLIDGRCVNCSPAPKGTPTWEERVERPNAQALDSPLKPLDPTKDLEEAYRFLECRGSDTRAEIDKKFREKAWLCHPDKFGGDSYEATRLFQDVEGAYRLIMASRGRR